MVMNFVFRGNDCKIRVVALGEVKYDVLISPMNTSGDEPSIPAKKSAYVSHPD